MNAEFIPTVFVSVSAGTLLLVVYLMLRGRRKAKEQKALEERERSIQSVYASMQAVQAAIQPKEKQFESEETPLTSSIVQSSLQDPSVKTPAVEVLASKKPSLPPLPKRATPKSSETSVSLNNSVSKIFNLPPPPSKDSASLLSVSADEDNVLYSSLLRKQEDSLNSYADFQETVLRSLSVGEILNKTCRALSTFLTEARVVYLEFEAAHKTLRVTARSNPSIFVGTQPRTFLADTKTNDIKQVFENINTDEDLQRLLKDASQLETSRVLTNTPSWKMYPLFVRGLPQGVFAVEENVQHPKDKDRWAKLFISHAAVALENLRLHTRVLEVASNDAATGLLSRKNFQDRLQQEFLVARRLRHPLTLLRLEVDHMGLFVKQHGTQVADAILRHVTRNLERHFRKSDVISRYCKEGFAVILPHTAVVDALKKSENLLQSLKASILKLNVEGKEVSLQVSLSAGLVEFPSHAESPADLMRLADEALYQGQSRDHGICVLARVPSGYIPPFNSRFVRSAPKDLQDRGSGPILDS